MFGRSFLHEFESGYSKKVWNLVQIFGRQHFKQSTKRGKVTIDGSARRVASQYPCSLFLLYYEIFSICVLGTFEVLAISLFISFMK